jgi:hypothetical protein
MDIKNISPELLDDGMRLAESTLLTAILKHLSQNNPEILRAIITDALNNVPTGKEFEGEAALGTVARHMLEHRLKRMVSDMTPPSQLGEGFQRQVL